MGMAMLTSLKPSPIQAEIGESHLQVDVLSVEQKDVPIWITGYGMVKALNVVPIAPEVAGKIVAIHPRLEAGETIPQGDLLFKIDPTDHMTVRNASRNRITILERSHELATKAHQRALKLFEKNRVGTLSSVEAAEKVMLSVADQINQISQVLETAETNLNRCDVRAPFNARIKSVSLEKGQYVTPGQPILTLADDAVLEILVSLDSRDARKWLRFDGKKISGKMAWFCGLEQIPCTIRWTENNNGQAWDGRLHRIVKFDQQTRTLTVAVRIDAATPVIKNPLALPLVEGMFCSVKIPGKILHDVIQLPRQAVSFENTVYLAVNNRLKTVPVKVARTEDEHVYVADGLNTGDMVVITRLTDPLENTLLQITNKTETEVAS
jgi:RND family efflux transporter MFP subunit